MKASAMTPVRIAALILATMVGTTFLWGNSLATAGRYSGPATFDCKLISTELTCEVATDGTGVFGSLQSCETQCLKWHDNNVPLHISNVGDRQRHVALAEESRGGDTFLYIGSDIDLWRLKSLRLWETHAVYVDGFRSTKGDPDHMKEYVQDHKKLRSKQMIKTSAPFRPWAESKAARFADFIVDRLIHEGFSKAKVVALEKKGPRLSFFYKGVVRTLKFVVSEVEDLMHNRDFKKEFLVLKHQLSTLCTVGVNVAVRYMVQSAMFLPKQNSHVDSGNTPFRIITSQTYHIQAKHMLTAIGFASVGNVTYTNVRPGQEVASLAGKGSIFEIEAVESEKIAAALQSIRLPYIHMDAENNGDLEE